MTAKSEIIPAPQHESHLRELQLHVARDFMEPEPDRSYVLTQDITVTGDQVDVNVHPTKHEEEMIQAISDALQEVHSGEIQ